QLEDLAQIHRELGVDLERCLERERALGVLQLAGERAAPDARAKPQRRAVGPFDADRIAERAQARYEIEAVLWLVESKAMVARLVSRERRAGREHRLGVLQLLGEVALRLHGLAFDLTHDGRLAPSGADQHGRRAERPYEQRDREAAAAGDDACVRCR